MKSAFDDHCCVVTTTIIILFSGEDWVSLLPQFEAKMGDLLPFEESVGGSNLVYAQWAIFQFSK